MHGRREIKKEGRKELNKDRWMHEKSKEKKKA